MGGYLDLEGGELRRSISWRQRLLKRTSVRRHGLKVPGPPAPPMRHQPAFLASGLGIRLV